MTRKTARYENHPVLKLDFPNHDAPMPNDSVGLTEVSVGDESGSEAATKKLTPYERLMSVRNHAGFFAHSARELDLALGSMENSEQLKGGFGQYLHEVLVHQKKSVSEDPAAAVRKILSEITEFAKDARVSVAMLSELVKEFPDSQLSTLDSSSRLEDWRLQETTRRGLRLLTSRDKLVNMSPEDRPDFTVTDEDVSDMMSRMRRYQADASIDGIAIEEASRFNFWTETLRSSRSHMVANPIAKAALSKLGLEQ